MQNDLNRDDEVVARFTGNGAGKAIEYGWPSSLDLEVLAEREPQPPRSIMEGLPVGYATGIFGHGGMGKSALALHLAICMAAGKPFCGLDVAQRRVLFLSCEDRADILHWRLVRICSHLGVDLAGLRGRLEIIDLVGVDSILFAPDPRTGAVLKAAYGLLEARISKCASEVLFIDGIADTFGGNENNRMEVKHFVNLLLALIPAETGALILIGHVNKATAGGSSGEGYSGSTAWHNSFRARWYLYPQVIEGDDGERTTRTGKLIFELQKSNHGEVGTQIEFKWDEDAHLFVGRLKGGTTEFDRRHQQREERRGALRTLQACVAVPAATTGRRTAYNVLSARPEFPDSLRNGKASIRRFWRHIEELRAMGYVREGSIRRSDRHYVTTLELTEEGLRACG